MTVRKNARIRLTAASRRRLRRVVEAIALPLLLLGIAAPSATAYYEVYGTFQGGTGTQTDPDVYQLYRPSLQGDSDYGARSVCSGRFGTGFQNLFFNLEYRPLHDSFSECNYVFSNETYNVISTSGMDELDYQTPPDQVFCGVGIGVSCSLSAPGQGTVIAGQPFNRTIQLFYTINPGPWQDESNWVTFVWGPPTQFCNATIGSNEIECSRSEEVVSASAQYEQIG